MTKRYSEDDKLEIQNWRKLHFPKLNSRVKFHFGVLIADTCVARSHPINAKHELTVCKNNKTRKLQEKGTSAVCKCHYLIARLVICNANLNKARALALLYNPTKKN